MCIGSSEIQGKRFRAGSSVEEPDHIGVGLACEQVSAEAFKGGRGIWIDVESLLPLRFAVGVLTGSIKQFGENEVRLDDRWIEACGLLDLGDCFRLVPTTKERQTCEVMKLRGGGVALECGLERVNGASEFVVARVPTAEKNGVVCRWMRSEGAN